MEFLEKQSVVNIERFKQRTKELKTNVQKELEVATLDAAGLNYSDRQTERQNDKSH